MNKPRGAPKSGKGLIGPQSSQSEATIYKRAVHQLAPELKEQIDLLVNNTRKSVEQGMGISPPAQRKNSSSSDELMDTSGETGNFSLIAEVTSHEQTKKKTVEEKVDDIVRDAECSRARMYDVEGKLLNSPLINRDFQNIALIDNDYQMIDAHLEETVKNKIITFEYKDLSRLLNKVRTGRDEDH